MDAIDMPRLARITGGRLAAGGQAAEPIRHVTVHSEHIMTGSIFFALPGTRADGHDFVASALRNGAVGAVVAAGRMIDTQDLPTAQIIEVDEPLLALHRLAAWWRRQVSGTVVAVVGSTGKTVVKDALLHILASEQRVYASPGSFNSKFGVPLALIECPANCDVAVIEAAATMPGEMATLQEIIQPDHVVLTNLSSRHAASFPGPVAHARELLSIATDCAGGWLLIGEPNHAISQAAIPLAPGTVYKLGDSDFVPGFNIVDSDVQGSIVEVHFPDGARHAATVRTPFAEILADVELALAAAWLLGIAPHSAVTAISAYVPTASRMEVWQSPGGWTVVRDVATTDAMTLTTALRVSRGLIRQPGRLGLVMADGLNYCTEEESRALGEAISRCAVDWVWALDTAPHQAIAKAIEARTPRVQVALLASLEAIRPVLTEKLRRDDVVLVESPRERTLVDVTSSLIEPLAPNRLFIDRAALESNVRAFRRIIGSHVQLMAMVKGLAYGTSPVQVSQALEAVGIDYLGVATADEGATLRQAGILVPVLVTLGTPEEVGKLVRYRLTPQIYSQSMLDSVIRYAHQNPSRQPVEIHLEVDTGMHRTGFGPAEAINVLERLGKERAIRVTGLMTHFACADIKSEDEFTHKQFANFQTVVGIAEDLGFSHIIKHAANTAATVRFPQTHLDLVRIGIGLYGIHPSTDTVGQIDLAPVASLVSQVVEIRDLSAGERIGYGGTFGVPLSGTRAAVVAAGYHDCIPLSFSNFGYVLISGWRCPIIGRVSMDSMVVDVTDCPLARVGSDVLIYGRWGGAEVSIEDVAAKIGTIPYELLTRVGPRVQRVLTQH